MPNTPGGGSSVCKSRKSVQVHILLSRTLGTQLCFRICNLGGGEDIRRVIWNIYYAASKVPVQYMNIPRAKRLNIHTVVLIKDYY